MRDHLLRFVRCLAPKKLSEVEAQQPQNVLPTVDSSSYDPALADLVMSGWFNHKTAELFAGVPIRGEHTVLDVGCGNGGYTEFCARQGAHVIFADVDAAKVHALEERLRDSPARRAEGIVSNCSPLPLPDACADVVICTEVIEHVDDAAALMRELARVGKRGAQYVLSAPDPVSENLLKTTAGDWYFKHPYHIRVLGRDEFERLVTDAGMIVDRHEYIGAYSTLFWMMLFMVGDPMEAPRHPILHNWMKMWMGVLEHPGGLAVKRSLDAAIPKTQVIVARKPD